MRSTVIRVQTVRVFRGISSHFDKRVGSWLLAAMMTHIGFVLLTNPNHFETFPVFGAMARIFPEHVWAYICLTFGALRLVALFINGTFQDFPYSPHIRAITSLLSCFVWLQFTLSFMSSPIESTGLGVYPYLLLFDVYNGFLAAQEAGRVKDLRVYGRADNVYRLARMGSDRR